MKNSFIKMFLLMEARSLLILVLFRVIMKFGQPQ